MSFKPYKPRDPHTTKDVVTRLLDEAGGVKRTAHLLGRSLAQTMAYSDPATTDEMTLDQARRLTSASGVALVAEDLAALAGGVFLPNVPASGCFDTLAATSARQWGDFVASLIETRADGRMDAAERAATRQGLDTLIRALACARAHLIADDGSAS